MTIQEKIEKIEHELDCLICEIKTEGDESRTDNVMEAVEQSLTEVAEEARGNSKKSVVNHYTDLLENRIEQHLKTISELGTQLAERNKEVHQLIEANKLCSCTFKNWSVSKVTTVNPT